MPKSKRNKTVDLSKTKKHGLEGKKELYKKIQSNVENYAHVFVFAVNDMRNTKMKNVRDQWKQSRFCIGKNKVMAMALGRTPEEEYRPNLHKIGQMLVGERGLLFTNQSVDEVTNWFQSYSEGDYARSGNIATEDVILPEGPLAQFPHNLESYLRQLGLPTTLKKGVIHLVKEHVVCTEGERLSPETARILKLLGYEMAEFRIKILSVWSQDGSFANLQSDSCDPESKENAASPPKSCMREDFELAKDCLLLGDEDEMEVAEDDSEDENKIENHIAKDSKIVTEDPEEEIEVFEVVKLQTPSGKKSLIKPFEDVEIISFKKKGKKSLLADKEKQTDSDDTSEKNTNSDANHFAEETDSKIVTEDPDEGIEVVEVVKLQTPSAKKSVIEPAGNSEDIEIISSKQKGKKSLAADKEKQIDSDDTSEKNTNSEGKVSDKSESVKNASVPTIHLEIEDVEMEVEEIQEPEVKKPKSDSSGVKKTARKTRKTLNKKNAEDEEVSSKEEMVDSAAILKLTQKKLEESAEKPKKFSPKMTRARAAAAKTKIKTPEPLETKRSSRKRKM